MTLLKSSERNRQTVHDLSQPRCPTPHQGDTSSPNWRKGTGAGCKSGPTMGNAPIITTCDPPPTRGSEGKTTLTWIHCFWIGTMALFNRVNSNHMNCSCPNSARCSIDLHSSEINSPKIQLQGITQNDIVRLPIVKHFPKAGGGKIFKGGLHDWGEWPLWIQTLLLGMKSNVDAVNKYNNIFNYTTQINVMRFYLAI